MPPAASPGCAVRQRGGHHPDRMPYWQPSDFWRVSPPRIAAPRVAWPPAPELTRAAMPIRRPPASGTYRVHRPNPASAEEAAADRHRDHRRDEPRRPDGWRPNHGTAGKTSWGTTRAGDQQIQPGQERRPSPGEAHRLPGTGLHRERGRQQDIPPVKPVSPAELHGSTVRMIGRVMTEPRV